MACCWIGREEEQVVGAGEAKVKSWRDWRRFCGGQGDLVPVVVCFYVEICGVLGLRSCRAKLWSSSGGPEFADWRRHRKWRGLVCWRLLVWRCEC